MPLNCIICSKALEPVNDDDYPYDYPYRGTQFETKGHYGSTYFDPLSDRKFLLINICDICLAGAEDREQVRRVTIEKSYVIE